MKMWSRRGVAVVVMLVVAAGLVFSSGEGRGETEEPPVVEEVEEPISEAMFFEPEVKYGLLEIGGNRVDEIRGLVLAEGPNFHPIASGDDGRYAAVRVLSVDLKSDLQIGLPVLGPHSTDPDDEQWYFPFANIDIFGEWAIEPAVFDPDSLEVGSDLIFSPSQEFNPGEHELRLYFDLVSIERLVREKFEQHSLAGSIPPEAELPSQPLRSYVLWPKEQLPESARDYGRLIEDTYYAVGLRNFPDAGLGEWQSVEVDFDADGDTEKGWVLTIRKWPANDLMIVCGYP